MTAAYEGPAALPAGARVAVVGAGVAGLTSAWLLGRRHDVTLYERNDYPGGHTHTVTVADGPDRGLAVDTGFIVMNHRNYPWFTRVLDRLGVRLQDSDMSFGYHCEETGFQYAGTGLDGLFAQRRNLFRPAFAGMVADIVRFNHRARGDLAAGAAAGLTLDEYVRSLRLSGWARERYLYAMAAAIWSSPVAEIGRFPAEAFLRFFDNHGLLAPGEAPTWRTVTGGSATYVRAMLADFAGRVRLNAPVREVRRAADGVHVATDEGAERHDAVVIAAHADEALRMLADPDEAERRLLGAWSYSTNHAVLHTDVRALPPRRAAWASWNYTRERAAGAAAPVSVTYDLTRLQRLAGRERYCVSLNRHAPVDPSRVVRAMTYTHPRYDFAALDSQRELPRLNGARRTWYCGSYFGWGFHEDAVRSAVEVARAFGVEP